jgi:hypothetical protein
MEQVVPNILLDALREVSERGAQCLPLPVKTQCLCFGQRHLWSQRDLGSDPAASLLGDMGRVPESALFNYHVCVRTLHTWGAGDEGTTFRPGVVLQHRNHFQAL